MTDFIRPGDCQASPEVFNRYTALAGRIAQHEFRALLDGPTDAFDLGRWWIDDMQQNQEKYESQSEHVSRCFICFIRFMNLSDIQRKAVIKGVTVRKTPYRGDGYDLYVSIVKTKIEADKNPRFKEEVIKKMRAIKILK
ncbi:MAG: hypothetical protein ACTSV7_00590 [Candidatus Baldrarchaeia archaeon]